MPGLHSSTRRCTARWLLACFAVVLLVAGLAPLTHSRALLERICTASGQARWVAAAIAGADAQPDASGHTLECALCLPALAAAPGASSPVARLPAPAPAVQQALPDWHLAPLSRAPFPPRAPPLLPAPHASRATA